MIDVGQIVGNYTVTAKLGEGGMGVVFLAEHPVIGRRAALKAIHPEFSGNAEVVARFVNEARSISQIGHDHIVGVTDFGRTEGGDFYLVMEYLAGDTLSDRLERESPLAPERAFAIAAQIADALAASHGCGVVHRDLKPENVILVERGGTRDFVKVLDFGLAKLAGEGGENRATQAGMIMGTPYYMAPEQCQGRGWIDARTDIYALGVMLFEMLTGRVPFGGESSREVLRKQVSMRPPAVRSFRPELPEVVDVLLQRALAKRPSDRFPSMAAFREALLFPMNHLGSTPSASVHDDMSGRVRAAQPMSRAEMLREGAAGHSTLRQGVGELVRHTETVVDLLPARSRKGAWLAVAAAVAAGAALAVGMARGRTATASASPLEVAEPAATPAVPTVRVTFGSDPHDVAVIDGEGRTLGVTPLSVAVPAGEAPVEFTFRRIGFLDKTITLIPNVSSPLFAIMQVERKPEPEVVLPASAPAPEPKSEKRVSHPTRAHRRTVAAQPPLSERPALPDGDSVLEPSFD